MGPANGFFLWCCSREDRDVICRRFHVLQLSRRRLIDLYFRAVVLVADHHLWRPVPPSRHIRWGKAIWVIALIIFPYLGIFIYLITQHRGMAERQSQRVQQAREDMRHFVGYSVADELEKLERLKNSGTISNEEYMRLRARAVQ